jgi:hypothetical protein
MLEIITLKNHRKFFSILNSLAIIFSILLITNAVSAQTPPDTMWTKTFGGTNIDIGHSVMQTSDGGYIVTGYTRSFGTMSGRNVWLIKTNESGILQWQNAFGGNDDEEGYSVRQTSDGGYIIAGYTKSSGAGGNDVYLIKANSAGIQEWTKTFGGPQNDEGYSVLQTPDGGYIVAGVTSSFGAGGRDVWLIKTDASGNQQWTRTLGGFGSDGAWSIVQTSDGGFAIAGWTFSHGPGFLGNAWLVKTDSAGFQQWHKAFGGTGVDRAHDVKQTNDGGFILTGYTSSSGAGLDDMLLIRTDSLGNEIWTKTFGGTGRDYGQSVQQTSFDGGFIVAGYTLSFGAGGEDMWLVRTDMNGNMIWNKTLGGSSSDVAYSVQQTLDGGFIITGHTLSFGAGLHDVWLVKIEPVGTSVTGNNIFTDDFYLFQNYPNPFNPVTKISFNIPNENFTSLNVYDVQGRLVQSLLNGRIAAGFHEVILDASALPGGIYFYKLKSGSFSQTRKMIIMK